MVVFVSGHTTWCVSTITPAWVSPKNIIEDFIGKTNWVE